MAVDTDMALYTQKQKITSYALDNNASLVYIILNNTQNPPNLDEVFFENDGALLTKVADLGYDGVVNVVLTHHVHGGSYEPFVVSAARNGCLGALRWYLRRTGNMVNVNACVRRSGETALHIAARFDLIEIAKLLLAYGADLECRDVHYHHTPLYVAISEFRRDMILLLLERGAKFYEHQVHMPAVIDLIARDPSGTMLRAFLQAGLNFRRRIRYTNEIKIVSAIFNTDNKYAKDMAYLWGVFHALPKSVDARYSYSQEARVYGVPRLQIQCLRVVFERRIDRTGLPVRLFWFPDLEEEAQQWTRYKEALGCQ